MKTTRKIPLLPKDAAYGEMDSPVGKLTIVTSTEGVHAVFWDSDRSSESCEKILAELKFSKSEKNLVATQQQLTEYFAGKRKKFDLPLVLRGSDFQIQAWQQLLKIPYAQTISYAQQAEQVGDKNKARAVGLANGKNPIPIIIPCHRVIGKNGALVGFGGGIDKKVMLLKLEQQYAQD